MEENKEAKVEMKPTPEATRPEKMSYEQLENIAHQLSDQAKQLYAKLQEQAADPMKMGAVQGQYGQFNSAATIIGTLQYNTAVYEYQKEVGGFPASVLGALSGVKEVEPFA